MFRMGVPVKMVEITELWILQNYILASIQFFLELLIWFNMYIDSLILNAPDFFKKIFKCVLTIKCFETKISSYVKIWNRMSG